MVRVEQSFGLVRVCRLIKDSEVNMKDWVRLLQPYEQAVEELKVKLKSLRVQYRNLSMYSPIEFTTGRVKSISSIIEKAKRYNIPLERVEEEMEDIAGLRIMCQFKEDIYVVVGMLKERHGKDFEIVYEKDYVSNPKESGYRSYHIIIKYPVYTAMGDKNLLVEIQIRTLAMNFWATIEHSLKYKYKQDVPKDISVRLKKAAIAATQLDEEMLAIRKEIINAQEVFRKKSNVYKEITTKIKYLVEHGKREVAEAYNLRFEALSRADSEGEIAYLRWEIDQYIRNMTKEKSVE